MQSPTHMTSIPSSNSIPPTIPFHVAQAYGVRPSAQVTRSAGASQNVGAVSQAPVASPIPTSAVGPATKLPSAAQKLVGATVPGRVDFSGDKPQQVTGASALQLYARPADRNAAATAVSIGRSLDVRG